MSYYPVFLDLDGQPALVVGAGEVGVGKILGLRRAGARVKVVAAEAVAEVSDLARRGDIDLALRGYRPEDVVGTRVVVAATDDAELNRAVADDARRAGVLVNVVDAPALSSFIAPAVVARGDLQIAVSTAGASPAFAVYVRDEIARSIGPEYGVALAVLRLVRQRLRESPASSIAERKQILRALAEAGLVARVKAGDREGVDEILRRVAGGLTLAALGVDLG